MNTINDIKRAIKPLGFTVRTKSLSWGPHATYEHIASKTKLASNVFTPETLAIWQPLFNWIRSHHAELDQVRQNTGIIGLKYV